MKVKEKRQRGRRETPKDKTSQKPQFRPAYKKYSPFDHFENWAEIQTEEDWSNYTADGPYYEIDEDDRLE